ncbi:hypothetical protein [Romboutsia ilealis]|uniref:hypothetical protein n=1 Tax=Romboutsia ilealis TaxID=1115758 RepID=UPI002729DEB8|nr:hypothetical protein [Romboutsia ilealis]
MKEIFLNGEVKKCTEKDIKVLEKFFTLEERDRVITVEKIPKFEEIYKLSTRQVFKDVTSIKKFIKFIYDNKLEYVMGTNPKRGRLIAVHSDHILHEDEDLMNVYIPSMLFNDRFNTLYPDKTRFDMVSLERFNSMTDKEINERQWIFDMGLTNRKIKTTEYENVFRSMVYIVKRYKLPFDCKIKNKYIVLKPNKNK